MTTVAQRLLRADGTAYTGRFRISWPTYVDATGTIVRSGYITVVLESDGDFSVSLAPHISSPVESGPIYTIDYTELRQGTRQTEYWDVPDSGLILDISDVITEVPSGPVYTPTAAPASASFLTRTGESALSNEFSLGSLDDGNVLAITVSGSTGTPRAATAVDLSVISGLATRPLTFSQTPGGSLVAATPATITLSPVPYGVNGTNTQHYLYISNGTGTAEAVLITGGTAVSGAASGTITFTPANNHTGAWTVSSATAGIQEALWYSQMVFLPAADYPTRATIYLPFKGSQIRGTGVGSYITPQSNGMTVIKGNGAALVGLSSFILADFLIAGAGFSGANTLIGIHLVSSYADRVFGVQFDNVKRGLYLDKVHDGIFDVELVNNSTVYQGSSTDGPTGYSQMNDIRIHHRATAALDVALGPIIINERAAGGTIRGFTAINLWGTSAGISNRNDTQGIIIEGGIIGTPSVGIEYIESTVGATTASPYQNQIRGTAIDQYKLYAIFNSDDSRFTSIQGCPITGSNTGTTEAHTIYSGGSTLGFEVTDCTFQNIKAGNCIAIDDGCLDFAVTNNMFANQLNGSNILIAPSAATNRGRVSGNLLSSTDTSTAYIGNFSTGDSIVVRDNIGVDDAVGATLASAATVTPTNRIHVVSGVAAIDTIPLPVGLTAYNGDVITFIPSGAWTTTTGGNIAVASTAVVGIAMNFTYLTSTGKWYPSY